MVEMDFQYIGGDIVNELIEKNKIQYGSDKLRFIHLDLIHDKLPKVDLIFCRDCLVHFSNAHVFQALRNIIDSDSTFLLTTTFSNREKNEDILTGSWRPINLQIPPLNFPEPIQMIDEKCPDDKFQDKNLGLWKISDIHLVNQKTRKCAY